MSGSGFVDKNLFGLKDKLRSYQNEKNTNDSSPVEMKNSEQPSTANNSPIREKEKEIKTNSSENTSSLNLKQVENINDSKRSSTDINSSANELKSEKVLKSNTIETKLDKEYLKALFARKQEFIHKRSDIIKRIQINLNKLPTDILKYEKILAESRSAQRQLELILNKVHTINEKVWDKYDYTLELAEAVRVIENSRLELFTLQQNSDCLAEEDIPGLPRENRDSLLPELTSLSFSQVFKIGIGFFLPLIIGILLASGIITFGMFMAMGIF